MTKKRLAYIDYARGICIILMIMGHIGFGDYFYQYIHAFHMPIFFLMSGYLYHEKVSLKDAIGRKVRQLLIPYLIMGGFHYVCWFILQRDTNDPATVLLNLLLYNTNDPMPIAGALWFLTCLFWVEVIFMIVMRYLRRFAWMVFIAFAVFGSTFTLFIPHRLPWALDVSFVAIGFYYVGYLLKQYQNSKAIKHIMSLHFWEVCIGFIAFSLLIMLNGIVNMRTGSYAIIPLSWLNALGFSIVLLNGCRCLEECGEHCTKLKAFCSPLRFVGENSIVYLCLNQFAILICRKIQVLAGLKSLSGIGMLAVRFGTLAVVLGLLYVAVRILSMRSLRFIIGR